MSSTSSDEEDIVMFLSYRRMKRRRQRRLWVHPYIDRNFHTRLFVGAREMQESDTTFLAFYKMSKESYIQLVETLSPAIDYVNTNMRECVNAEERILITLRYLATGWTFVALGLYFCRGETTVGKIISDTTRIIWNELKGTYMPCPTRDQWKSIAERFQTLWNLPNCIGATGSTNFNYKSNHSLALLGCCDVDGIFTIIETGNAGRNSDGGIFRASAIKNLLSNSRLDIPPPSKLPLDDYDDCLFPYYFVGDEAFPLSPFLMRPYSKRILDNTKRVFNYRLSRARKTIECTFGMMTEKFQVLSTAIRCRDENTVNNIIKSVCVLHNYIRQREGCQYLPQQVEQDVKITGSVDPIGLPVRAKINICSTAYAIRDYLAHYFLISTASLS